MSETNKLHDENTTASFIGRGEEWKANEVNILQLVARKVYKRHLLLLLPLLVFTDRLN